MRSVRSFLFALALAALVTAACSSSGDDGADAGDGGTSEAPAQTDASTYVDGVCTALTDWQTGMATDNATLEAALAGTPAPEDTKTALTDFLSATVDGTQAMVSDIEALGVPDVEGGDEVASTLSSALGEVVTLFEGALDDVESLSTEDPQAMVAALGELSTNITEGSSDIGAALGDLDTPELEAAAEDSAACDALTG